MKTRPTLERWKTLGYLRFINRNMIIHFANQSQTCQLLKILTRSLYVASFLVIFFFFFFFKIPVHCIFPGHFHSFFVTFSFSIPVHWIFPSHLHFHSVALLFIFREFWRINGCKISNFYSLIHPYSTCTVSHQDYLIIRYMYICTRYARFFNACFAYHFLICRPIISFTNFIKSLLLLVIFLLNFRHGLSIDQSHVHCQFINDRFIRNFNKFQSYVALKTRWGKSDTLHCHMGVMWFDAPRWLAASRRLIIFLSKYCDMS